MRLPETLLEVNNLKMYFPITAGVFRKKVGDVKAVDDVSFTVENGEFLFVVGPSGAGKTSIFNVLNAVYRPQQGSARLDGGELLDLGPADTAELGVAEGILQSGIKHPPHHGVGGQELRQAAGIGGLLIYPQRQGFKTALQQVAVAGIQAAPQVAGQVKNLLCMGLRRYRDAAAQVAVAAQVFGAAVHDNVDAQM